jgi:hypothetical protein
MVSGGSPPKATNGSAPAGHPEGESKFARALASTDYRTREKGWRALQIWLQRKQEVRIKELLKIWRGILFCFWHSDKAHVQEQLATQLAEIMHSLTAEVRDHHGQGLLFAPDKNLPRSRQSERSECYIFTDADGNGIF